jgi:hypothetical protein
MVHDGYGVHGLLCGGGPHIPRARGWIRGDLHGILPVGTWCTIASVPLLIVVVLWPRAAQSDSLKGPTHCCLREFVRDLHRD